MGSKLSKILAALGLLYLISTVAFSSGRVRPPGILVAEAPYQEKWNSRKKFKKNEFLITPLAEFSMEGRVLSTERYWFGTESELAPVDLALGWNRMSDSSVLDELTISQGGRFYYWHAKNLPLPMQEIISSSANMHLIPANDQIEKKIKKAQKGDVVEIDGFLVRVDRADGWRWVSSLRRNDSGSGACEVVWVEEFSIN